MDAAERISGQPTLPWTYRPGGRRGPRCRRRFGGWLMITCDGAGASHDLVRHLDKLAARLGRQLIYSVGWLWESGRRRRCGWCPRRPAARHRSRGEVRERRADDACADISLRAPGLLDRGSPRHRADRAAARGTGRGQAQGLARHDARVRAPRAAASRRPADLVRSRGRLAVLAVGDEPARRHHRAGWGRTPISTPRTGSRPGSRTPSGPGRTPAWATSPPTTSRSTPPG